MNITDAHKLAITLMRQYSLIGNQLGAPDWQFRFDTATRRFGCCHYKKRVISLSAPITKLNNESHVRDTILHEIAHALADASEGHGKQWVGIAEMIGCTGTRLYDSSVVAQPRRKWAGKCPGCGRVIQRYRRADISCSHCSSTYDPRFKFDWEVV